MAYLASSIGESEMLNIKLTLSGAPRAAPSSLATLKTVALFSKKKPEDKAKPVVVSPADEELAEWDGFDHRIFLSGWLLDRFEIPEYLIGEVPGDYG